MRFPLRFAHAAAFVAMLLVGGCSTPVASKLSSKSRLQVANAPSNPGPRVAAAAVLQEIADSRPDRYLIRNASLTLEARDALRNGADFNDIVKEYSEEPDAKTTLGSIRSIRRRTPSARSGATSRAASATSTCASPS